MKYKILSCISITVILLWTLQDLTSRKCLSKLTKVTVMKTLQPRRDQSRDNLNQEINGVSYGLSPEPFSMDEKKLPVVRRASVLALIDSPNCPAKIVMYPFTQRKLWWFTNPRFMEVSPARLLCYQAVIRDQDQVPRQDCQDHSQLQQGDQAEEWIQVSTTMMTMMILKFLIQILEVTALPI